MVAERNFRLDCILSLTRQEPRCQRAKCGKCTRCDTVALAPRPKFEPRCEYHGAQKGNYEGQWRTTIGTNAGCLLPDVVNLSHESRSTGRTFCRSCDEPKKEADKNRIRHGPLHLFTSTPPSAGLVIFSYRRLPRRPLGFCCPPRRKTASITIAANEQSAANKYYEAHIHQSNRVCAQHVVCSSEPTNNKKVSKE